MFLLINRKKKHIISLSLNKEQSYNGYKKLGALEFIV